MTATDGGQAAGQNAERVTSTRRCPAADTKPVTLPASRGERGLIMAQALLHPRHNPDYPDFGARP